MAIDTLRGRTRRSADRADHEEIPLPIGESDANIFDCPACARPLAVGTPRCPSCRTRLVAGVKATKAAGFLAGGLAAGLLIGLAGTATALVVSGSGLLGAAGAGAGVVPTAAPGASAPAGGVPIASPPTPVAPSLAISALRQVAMLNQRIDADAARLKAAVGAKKPSSVEIARVLRALAATSTFGDRIAPSVGTWPEAAELSSGLVDFYARIGETARDGLASSLTNSRGYIRSGRTMLKFLAVRTQLDAAARDLATIAGVDLAPLVSPRPEGAVADPVR